MLKRGRKVIELTVNFYFLNLIRTGRCNRITFKGDNITCLYVFLLEKTLSLRAVISSCVVGDVFPKEENVLVGYNQFVLVTTSIPLSVSSLDLDILLIFI